MILAVSESKNTLQGTQLYEKRYFMNVVMKDDTGITVFPVSIQNIPELTLCNFVYLPMCKFAEMLNHLNNYQMN